MIKLSIMTREQMHEFFKEFHYDPLTAPPGTTDKLYIYQEELVDEYFDKHTSQGKLHFAVLLDGCVIGDVYLKHIDHMYGSCELGIHMVNDHYKGKGYGAAAIKLVVDYGFDQLHMNRILADTLITNLRSQRALKKAGFHCIGQNDRMRYYECSKSAI